MKLLLLELRLLSREGAAWALLALFAAALAYGLWNGAGPARAQRERAEAIAEGERQWDEAVQRALEVQPVDPREITRRPTVALLSPAPLPLLATGQSDLAPSYEAISLWRLATPSDSRSELENPSRLVAGRFDLAFVLIWLFPLVLLALTYDLFAGERESGTLRMALAQGAGPRRWLALRAFARGAPALALAALGTLAAGALAGEGAVALRLALALFAVLAYGLFWLALAAIVNAHARGAAAAATALGAAWVLFVMVIPSLLNLAVESLHPTPSRPELIASARAASAEAERRGGELVETFYRHHPELAPPDRRIDFAQHALAVQEDVGRAIDPVLRRFAEQQERQQALVDRLRFLSPAIAFHEVLTELAGTGYWRHRAFRAQVETFKERLHEFYAPRIHQRRALLAHDAASLPRFEFAEEPASTWTPRVAWSLFGILAFAALLTGASAHTLAPRRLEALAS